MKTILVTFLEVQVKLHGGSLLAAQFCCNRCRRICRPVVTDRSSCKATLCQLKLGAGHTDLKRPSSWPARLLLVPVPKPLKLLCDAEASSLGDNIFIGTYRTRGPALLACRAVRSGQPLCRVCRLFERRSWCRFLGPIGGMNGLFGKLAMTEV